MNIQTIIALVVLALIIAAAAYASFADSQKKKNIGAGSAEEVISKHTTIRELLNYDEGIAEVLKAHGMHCIGCPSSAGEELWQACSVHSIDEEELLKDIIEYVNSKQ